MTFVVDAAGVWTVVCPACADVFGGGTAESRDSALDGVVLACEAHTCTHQDAAVTAGAR